MSLQLPERGAPPSNYTYSEYGSSVASSSSSATPSKPIISSSSASSAISSSSTRTRRKSAGAGASGSASMAGNVTSSAVKTRTARPPASPFIVSGKGKAASTPSSSFTTRHQHHHHQHNIASNGHNNNNNNNNNNPVTSQHQQQQQQLDEIAHMNDTRRLEDMLAHNQSLLDNSALCAILPGGIANVQARNIAMKERLEHLYAMREINLRMQDGVAINDDRDAHDGKHGDLAFEQNGMEAVDDESERKPIVDHLDIERVAEGGRLNALSKVESDKSEEEDAGMKTEESETDTSSNHTHDIAHRTDISRQHSGGSQSNPQSPSLLQGGDAFQSRTHINGNSPPLSSSPTSMSNGGFHRSWKANIANRTTMVGKVGQLSMDESLDLLQQRVNHRLRAQVELERVSAERQGGSQASNTSHLVQSRRGNGAHIGSVGDMQIANSADGDALALTGQHPEEEDDFDWHTAGYYHDDAEG